MLANERTFLDWVIPALSAPIDWAADLDRDFQRSVLFQGAARHDDLGQASLCLDCAVVMSASAKPRLAGRQPSIRGGVPRVRTWLSGKGRTASAARGALSMPGPCQRSLECPTDGLSKPARSTPGRSRILPPAPVRCLSTRPRRSCFPAPKAPRTGSHSRNWHRSTRASATPLRMRWSSGSPALKEPGGAAAQLRPGGGDLRGPQHRRSRGPHRRQPHAVVRIGERSGSEDKNAFEANPGCGRRSLS